MNKSEKLAVCREILSDPMFIECLSGECDHSEWLRLMNEFVDSLEDNDSIYPYATTTTVLTVNLITRAITAIAADAKINIHVNSSNDVFFGNSRINRHHRTRMLNVDMLPMHVDWNGTTLTIQNQPTVQGMYDYYKFVRFFSNERGAYITRK